MARKRKSDQERIAVAGQLRRVWDERKKAAKFTQLDASVDMDMSQSSISDYLNARMPLGFEAAIKFARFLKCKPSDFDARFREIEATVRNVSAFDSVAESASEYVVRAKVPLFAWSQAAQWPDVDARVTAEWVTASADVGPQAFALHLQGDSMLNPHGAPSFFEGMLLIIDPAPAATRGDFVIATIGSTEEPIFRQYVIEGPDKYLKALNPRYPLIELGESAQFLGVVREAKVLL